MTGAAGFFGPSELVHPPPPALGDGLPLRAKLMTCGTALRRAFVEVSSQEVGMGVAPIKCVGGGAPGRREVVTVCGSCGGGSGGGGGEGDEGGKGGEAEAALKVPSITMPSRS